MSTRFAPTTGKSGSERVCYALFPRLGLVLPVTVFGKDDKDNLTALERNAVKAMLAKFLCVSSATIQSREPGRRVLSPIARRLLDEMDASPEHFQARFAHLAAPISDRSLPLPTSKRGGTSDPEGKRVAKKPRVKTS